MGQYIEVEVTDRFIESLMEDGIFLQGSLYYLIPNNSLVGVKETLELLKECAKSVSGGVKTNLERDVDTCLKFLGEYV